jgi:hypothetical protein
MAERTLAVLHRCRVVSLRGFHFDFNVAKEYSSLRPNLSILQRIIMSLTLG